MTTRITKQVVKVEAIGDPRNTGGGFATKVRYTFDDGTTYDTHYNSRLKRDALPGIARFNAKAEAGDVTGDFNEQGFIGTRTIFHMGLSKGLA